MNTDDLIDRARSGDVEAFAEVFESLRPRTLMVACRLVGHDAAEDVVMEAYLKAWRSIGSFRGNARLSSWLYRIVYNCAMDYLRGRKRLRESSLDAADPEGHTLAQTMADPASPRPMALMEAQEQAGRLERSMSRLAETHRATLLLRYVDGLTYAEIAAATGVAIGTVMSRLFHAKRKLQCYFGEESYGT